MQLCTTQPASTAAQIYQAALASMTPNEKLSMHAGSLKHASILARYYAGKLTGKSEVAWLVQIDSYWYAGSFDHVSDDHEGSHVITDYKTNAIPCQQECDYGVESVLYRTAYHAIHRVLPSMRYVRLSQHWKSGSRSPVQALAAKPIPASAFAEITLLVNQIRNLPILRRFGADCVKCPVASLCMKPDDLLPKV